MCTWTLEEFWCSSFKSHPLRLTCMRSPGCIHPSMLTHRPLSQWKRQIACRGVCIIQTWKVMSWGEFLSSEDGKKLMIHPMYLFDNVAALWSGIWGLGRLLQPSVQAHLILMIISGRGGFIFKSGKCRLEVTSCPLRMAKSSWFIPCTYHFDRTSDLVEKTNSNYNRAEEEFNTFESFKCNKYRPNEQG